MEESMRTVNEKLMKTRKTSIKTLSQADRIRYSVRNYIKLHKWIAATPNNYIRVRKKGLQDIILAEPPTHKDVELWHTFQGFFSCQTTVYLFNAHISAILYDQLTIQLESEFLWTGVLLKYVYFYSRLKKIYSRVSTGRKMLHERQVIRVRCVRSNYKSQIADSRFHCDLAS